MLFTYIMVGIALAIPEIVIVNNCAWLKRRLESNSIIEIVFSILLGVVMGASMGVTGVTFAIGNVFSTIITKGVYVTGILDRWPVWRTQLVANQAKFKANYLVFLRVLRFWWRVISAPARACFWISARASEASGMIKRAKRAIIH